MVKLILLLVFLITVSSSYAIICENSCEYQNECLGIGTQKLTLEQGITYCSETKTMKDAKLNNELCNYNYECVSFYCDGTCKEFKKSTLLRNSIIILVIISSLFSLYLLKNKLSKKKLKLTKIKNVAKEPLPKKVKITQIKRKTYDPLEEQIKKSLEKAQKIFKRK